MTREDVLREYGSTVCLVDVCKNTQCLRERAMSDEIVRLRAALARMACPVCHEVNPAEVHTCTPAPKVTMVDEWRVITNYGMEDLYGRYGNRADAERSCAIRDEVRKQNAPHTVRRVALIDDNNGENK